MSRLFSAAAAILLASALSSRAFAQPSHERARRAERSSFVFHNGFWLNLHNFLHRAAKERRGVNDEVPAAMTVAARDTARARALTPSERDAWERALQVCPLSDGLGAEGQHRAAPERAARGRTRRRRPA